MLRRVLLLLGGASCLACATATATVPKSSPLPELLDRRVALDDAGKAAEVAALDAQIRAQLERPLAVMITDLSGFTATTKRLGILGFLSQVRRLVHLALPLITQHGARLIKVDADDLFVVHESPEALLGLARALQAAIAAHNQRAPERTLGLAVGLGFGPTLDEGHDVWGDSVNTASRLGEDVGRADEVLATDAFVQALPEAARASCTAVEKPAERGSKEPFFSCR